MPSGASENGRDKPPHVLFDAPNDNSTSWAGGNPSFNSVNAPPMTGALFRTGSGPSTGKYFDEPEQPLPKVR